MSSRHDGVVERLGEPLRLSDTNFLNDGVDLKTQALDLLVPVRQSFAG